MLRRLFKSYNPLQTTKSLTPFTNYYFSSRSPAQILQERGLLNQTSSDTLQDPDFVKKTKEKYSLDYISTYTGYDPTADSLHLGNLLTIISVLRLKEAGIRPIFLVGGATGFIGDPSGKSKDRELLGSGELENNTSGIENTLKKTARNILLYLKENKEKLGLQYET